MKVVIAGSRGITGGTALIEKATQSSGLVVTEVVSGCARGIDTLGEHWARERGIPVKLMPAHWSEYGKSAGFLRNKEMGKYADGLVAIWDGHSRGTLHMIDFMRTLGKPVHVFTEAEESHSST